MAEKENKEKEEFSFVTFFSKLFGKKKVQYVKVKKKKKKEFIAINVPKKKEIKVKDDDEPKVDVKLEGRPSEEQQKKNIAVFDVSKSKIAERIPKQKDEKINDDSNNVLDSISKPLGGKDNVVDDSKNDFSDSKDNERDLFLQKNILMYFEKYLKDREYVLKSYLEEYEEYDKVNEESLLYDEVKETSDKVDLLIDKINKLKEEILNLEKKFSNDEFDIDDSYITFLVSKYMREFRENFDVEKFDIDNRSNKYKPLLVKIEEIDYVVNKLSGNLKDKTSEYDERDKDFERFREEYYRKDDLFDSIKLMIKENDYLLKDIEYKVEHAKEVFTEVEVVHRRINNNLTQFLFLYATIRNNPLVPNIVKSAICTNMMIQGFRAFFAPFRAEHRIRTRVTIHDYEKEIIDGLKSMDDVFKLIDNTMESVVDLKKEFKDKFSDYDLLEYNQIMDKLSELSKHLAENREYLVKSKDKFSEELEKNKVKVKELDYDSYDEELYEVEDTE